MKILIIGFTKIKYMPYLNFYFDNINKKNEIHILYWNRDLKGEDLTKFENVIFHEFRCFQKDDISKITKIRSFIKYKKFAKEILKKNNFDFVIVLHTLPGVLISNVLFKEYLQKYILDYRDSTYEWFFPFKKRIGRLVKNSKYTFVSSKGFVKYLPDLEKHKIYISHNLLLDSLNHRKDREKEFAFSDRIRISFWGFIRQKELNISIIDKISKDNRFELHYYGREQQIAFELKEHVNNNEIKNVFFHGEYRPEDRYKFIQNTDLIHNIYFDRNSMLSMGNKYYDGIIFKIPQLCMKDSYMGQRAMLNGIGLECDPFKADFTDAIFSYYRSLQLDQFNKNCDMELECVLKEYQTGEQIINECTL